MGPRIKGAAFREFLRWYAPRFPDRLAAVARDLPDVRLDPDKDGAGVLASSWYSAASVHATIDALLAGLASRQRAELARGAGRATLERTLTGVYRLLFQIMATPERYARHAQRLWDGYYDTGTITIDVGPGRAESRIAGWAAHHPFICEMHVHAAACIYENMRLEGVVSNRRECVALGGTVCRIETTWRTGP